VQQMTDQMARLTRTLSDWVQAEPRSLQEIEAQVVRTLHRSGQEPAGCPHAARRTRPSRADVACACGQIARYVRMRLATGATVLGRVTLEQATSRCPPCGT
jgi:hypothetical protein